MNDDRSRTDLQIRPSERQIQKLESHEQFIERVAGAYFSACREAARWVSRLKRQDDD